MSKKFVKPTIEEIKIYAKEVFPQLDAVYFFNYYESCGWVVGKSRKPMTSWKAAVITFKRNFETDFGKKANNIKVSDENWQDKYRKV